jgi:G protein beta subunit-like protein
VKKQFLAAGGNPHIRLYEIASREHQQPVLTLEGHQCSVTALGFQRDGRFLYSSSEDGTIKLWDLRNPHFSRSFNVKTPVRSVCLRQDRDQILSGDSNGFIKIWDLGGNGRSSENYMSRGSHKCNKIDPDNGYIYQVQPGKGQTGGCLLQTSIQSVDISEDSRTFAAVSNHGMAYIWDPVSQSNAGIFLENQPITKFRAHSSGHYCLHAKISPDCRHLMTTGSDGSARLFDTTTWERTHNLQAHTKWVWDAAFCADSSYLVTVSSDSTAKLWNLRSMDVIRKYQQHQGAVTCVALNDSA